MFLPLISRGWTVNGVLPSGQLLTFLPLCLLSASSNILTDLVVSFYDKDKSQNALRSHVFFVKILLNVLFLDVDRIFLVRWLGAVSSLSFRKRCAFLKQLVILALSTSKSCV